MKRAIITIGVLFFVSGVVAQDKLFFVRHDTTVLNAAECDWVVRTLINNDQTSSPKKAISISEIILDAIEKGKLKAADPQTEQIIPADKIRTWDMPADTMMIIDSNDIQKITVVQRSVAAEWLSSIKIYSDWYFDIGSGKFTPVVKRLDMMTNVYSSSGMLIGKRPYFRIYY